MRRISDFLADIQSISAAEIYSAAKKNMEIISRNIQNWEDMADEYAREGFSPEYCIHGTRMWVDYDCACWRCELGDDPRDITLADCFVELKDKKVHAIRKIEKLIETRDEYVQDFGDVSVEVIEKTLLVIERDRIPTREDILG